MKRSKLWSYFKKEGAGGDAVCNICNQRVETSGNTSNLASHMKNKHQGEEENGDDKPLGKLQRERCPNFNSRELDTLKDLIKKHSNILLNSKTDSASAKKKERVWNKITTDFNSVGTCFRTTKQLRYKFDNLKQFVRKDASKERQEKRKTGGGPSTFRVNEVTEWFRSVMPVSMDGNESVYDDDVLSHTLNNSLPENQNILQVDTNLPVNEKEVTVEEIIIMDEFPENSVIAQEDLVDPVSEKEVFDTSTPAAMLRCPISTPLRRVRKRNAQNITPLELRRNFSDLSSAKKAAIERKNISINKLSEMEEERHCLKIKHEKELHAQTLLHGVEKHALEIEIFNLQKQKLLEEIEKIKRT